MFGNCILGRWWEDGHRCYIVCDENFIYLSFSITDITTEQRGFNAAIEPRWSNGVNINQRGYDWATEATWINKAMIEQQSQHGSTRLWLRNGGNMDQRGRLSNKVSTAGMNWATGPQRSDWSWARIGALTQSWTEPQAHREATGSRSSNRTTIKKLDHDEKKRTCRPSHEVTTER